MKTVIEMAREVYGEHTFWTGPQLERLEQFAELVRADERAECAVIAETAADYLQNSTFEGVAAAIRARSNT
jgi:hypothetical protein